MTLNGTRQHSLGNPDPRKITRNLSLTFAAFGDIGQEYSKDTGPLVEAAGIPEVMKLLAFQAAATTSASAAASRQRHSQG